VNGGSFRTTVTDLLTAAAQDSDSLRVYLASSTPGEQPEVSQPATPQLIRTLGVLYDALAAVNPRMVVVPLTSCAGWSPDQVSNPSTITSRTVKASVADSDQALTYPLSPLLTAHANGPIPASHAHTSSTAGVEPGGEPIQLPHVLWTTSHPEPSSDDPAKAPVLGFSRVAMGGTFDRLHCGHELLLATTALVATHKVYVGITADQLLVHKKYSELLQPYEQREAAALGFMQAVRPALIVESGALIDPKAPTQAELDPLMEAVVVSQETLPGAHQINQGRVARGFSPLVVVVVPVIGGLDAATKLSSTQLRAQETAAATAVRLVQ